MTSTSSVRSNWPRQLRALRQIADVAYSIATMVETRVESSLPKSFCLSVPAMIDLPDVLPISDYLVSFGLDAGIAQKISRVYMNAADGLKRESQHGFRVANQACMEVNLQDGYNPIQSQEIMRKLWKKIYADTLQRWLDDIVRLLRSHHIIAESGGRQGGLTEADETTYEKSRNVGGHKQIHDDDAIEILEKSFLRNRRPSRQEKLDLATRTMMDYKQISVWFQNRRRRSKPSTSTHCGITLQRSVEATFEGSMADVLHTVEQDESKSTVTTLSAAPCADFNAIPPPNAFPAYYPPSCSHIPFSPPSNLTKFDTPWPRQANSIRPCPVETPDVNALEELLQRLRLSDGHGGSIPESDLSSSSSSSQVERGGACCTKAGFGFTIVVPPAPLPSLLSRARPAPDARRGASSSLNEWPPGSQKPPLSSNCNDRTAMRVSSELQSPLTYGPMVTTSSSPMYTAQSDAPPIPQLQKPPEPIPRLCARKHRQPHHAAKGASAKNTLRPCARRRQPTLWAVPLPSVIQYRIFLPFQGSLMPHLRDCASFLPHRDLVRRRVPRRCSPVPNNPIRLAS